MVRDTLSGGHWSGRDTLSGFIGGQGHTVRGVTGHGHTVRSVISQGRAVRGTIGQGQSLRGVIGGCCQG
jgi:hypothetical protein